MPAIVVAAAVWGGAALAAGGLTVLGTIAAVGAIASGVGVVTGNKDLMKVGAVMGLVGGVGALAESAGVMSTAAVAENSTAAVPEQLSGPGMGSTNVAQETVANAAPDVAKDVATTAGTTPEGAPLTQVGAPAAAPPPNSPQSILMGQNPTVGGYNVNPATGDVTGAAGDVVNTTKPFFEKTGQFIKENQMFSYGLMQVGGAAMQGLFDPTKAAQVELLDANAKLAQQRAANIAAGVPTGTVTGPRPSVFTAPGPYRAPTVGLINSTVVTGKPA